ncbi:hypothetical protein CR205_10665 [Alteribacter lacisalsi]|uniref:Uncharacterized protein n=1 Tax=Alteribacter lacisalsi TaxID=2045244 RepID=A0A2W0HYW9_9BACI|nr:hypothetical protein [Alteribacter lacisalsi]PYZ98998.1 hypothetical protein CR205_10665 [Alteribacter lacisalsi]
MNEETAREQEDRKDARIFYSIMTGIFLIVTLSSIGYVFNAAAERTLNFPTHLLAIGFGFGVWSILLWRRRQHSFAYIMTLCSAYALLLVLFTMIAS